MTIGKSKATRKINIKSFTLPWCYKNKDILILRHRLCTLADMIDWEVTLETTKNQNSNLFTLCLHM